MSRAPVVTFADPDEKTGASKLVRSRHGVQVLVGTTDLEPRTAVTLWMVVFNNPAACEGPCDEPDIFENPNAKADVLYASGRVIGRSGRAWYFAHRRTGDATGSILPVFGLPSYGILDPRKAEIHMVLRSHGPLIPGLVREMISTFAGGCSGFPEELGTPGPNECVDVQFAVHAAPLRLGRMNRARSSKERARLKYPLCTVITRGAVAMALA